MRQPRDFSTIPKPRMGRREEYRQQERLRASNSCPLAEKYPHLDSLTVNLRFCNPEVGREANPIKYSVNLTNAKSVFRFDCPNTECIEGDFDLSRDLAKAYDQRREEVSVECRCRGWRNKHTVGTHQCQQTLHYVLTLLYDDDELPHDMRPDDQISA